MANVLFDPGREGFLAGEIDWDTATIKAALTRSYTLTASHKFVSDATGAGADLISTFTLTSKSVTNGVADAADGVWLAVAAGAAATSILIFQSSAVTGGGDVAASAQRLIAFLDSATNLPVTPNGGDINCAWDNGASKIFKL